MKKYLLIAVSLVIVVGINVYYRAYPITFPQFKARARAAVEDNIRQKVVADIYGRFPQYDMLAKQRLIKTNEELFLRQNKKDVQKGVGEIYRKFKDPHQDENGQTYLMELDCWHWTRYVDNIVIHGYPGDTIVDGKQFDTYMLAPNGCPLGWDNFLYYSTAFLYGVFCAFKFVPLRTFCFYLPLVYIAIFIVVLYGYSFYYGRYAGAALTCLLVGLSPSFIPRSCAGWFDKDILCMLFPLAIVWPYLMAYRTAAGHRQKLWIFFSSLWVGLFCFTWTDWWFAFLFVVIYELFCAGGNFILLRWQHKEEHRSALKQHVVFLSMFMGFSVFWIVLFAGFQPLGALFHRVTSAVVLSKALVASIWPNVFSTVGELKKLNFKEVANTTGDGFLFVVSVICLFVILFRNLWSKRYAGFMRASSILLTVWFLSMLYACFQGARFAMFLITPLAIALAWTLNDLYEYFRNRRRKIIGFFVAAAIFLFLSAGLISRAQIVSSSLYPLMNDTWYKVLRLMKDTTPKDAILNSWWDFGDWFKVAADRRVIFDGQSQDKPLAYWMGKAILSQNEREAIGILRMLNNGGNKAFEIINKHIKDPLRSVLLLGRVLPLSANPKTVKKVLLEFLPRDAVDEAVKVLCGKPPPAYFIVDPSMQSKMPAISFLGSWDFAKVYVAQNIHSKEKEAILDYLIKLGWDTQQVRQYYQEAFLISRKDLDGWVSHPVQFYSGSSRGQRNGNAVFFDNSFIYNMTEGIVYATSGQVPQSMFLIKGNDIVETMYPNANVGFSILIWTTNEGYRSVLLDPSLGRSLFARLYFLNGFGLKHFTAHVVAEEGNDLIAVYKINW